MNNLHSGGRWLYRIRSYYPLLIIGIFVAIQVFPVFKLISIESPILGPILTFIFYILFIIVVGEIYARMSYNRFLYEVNNDEVKIEQGIIWKKYTSIPYERIQNVEIHRGIIARMSGFSTVQIETAGQSGWGGVYFRRRGYRQYKSEGYLPAIDVHHAEEIRHFIMKKIKHTHKNSGI